MNTDLYHGDSSLVLSDLYDKGVRVDLTVTSPPYDNLRNSKDSCVWNFDVFKGIAEQIVKITKQGG